jgi:hypothetical protein
VEAEELASLPSRFSLYKIALWKNVSTYLHNIHPADVVPGDVIIFR